MSAANTAVRVLQWASVRHNQPPPSGDLRELDALVKPDKSVHQALSRLATVSAARLSLTASVLKDAEPPGPTTVWLAAAVGAACEPEASAVVKCCQTPTPQQIWELVARHALIQPALPHLPPTFAEMLTMTSPLTGLLLMPPAGQEDELTLHCEALLDHRDGRRLLVYLFCDPQVSGPMLSWRGRLLEMLRLQRPYQSFVLDVYEAAIALHAQAWLTRIGQARRILSSPGASSKYLNLALSVARWWAPLRALRRAHSDWLRARRYMDFHIYLQGIQLASEVARLRGEGS